MLERKNAARNNGGSTLQTHPNPESSVAQPSIQEQNLPIGPSPWIPSFDTAFWESNDTPYNQPIPQSQPHDDNANGAPFDVPYAGSVNVPNFPELNPSSMRPLPFQLAHSSLNSALDYGPPNLPHLSNLNGRQDRSQSHTSPQYHFPQEPGPSSNPNGFHHRDLYSSLQDQQIGPTPQNGPSMYNASTDYYGLPLPDLNEEAHHDTDHSNSLPTTVPSSPAPIIVDLLPRPEEASARYDEQDERDTSMREQPSKTADPTRHYRNPSQKSSKGGARTRLVGDNPPPRLSSKLPVTSE